MKLLKIGVPIVLLAGLSAWFFFPNIHSTERGLPPLHTVTVDEGDIAQ